MVENKEAVRHSPVQQGADKPQTPRAERAEKKVDLNKELAAANEAVKDLLLEHAVSQGLHDKDVKESKQNDPKNSPDAPKETIEDFEKIKEDRLKEAAKKLDKKN